MPGKRLLIVVPYRDREAHLRQFVPHVRAYFARDKVDRTIDYRCIVVEQEGELPFNAGALKNAGFALGGGDSDYTCFNDVDYLPVWADYAWTDVPTPLVWYGAETRPVAPGESGFYLRHDLDQFFGAAVLVPNEAFRRVDGYSNLFWGWGYEDADLRARFKAVGIVPGRRRGTFQALDHRNAGFDPTGRLRSIALANQALYERKRASPRDEPDGLSTIDFEVVDRQPIADPRPERNAEWELVKVRLRTRPSDEQMAAIRSDAEAAP
jgi:hypothetical protein